MPAIGLEAGIDALAHGMWRWNERRTEAMPASASHILGTVVSRGILGGRMLRRVGAFRPNAQVKAERRGSLAASTRGTPESGAAAARSYFRLFRAA
jgi:hypothetical protein